MQSLIVFTVFGKLDMDSMVDNEIIYSICKRNPLHREVHLHQSEQTAVDGPLDVGEVPPADAVNALVVHLASISNLPKTIKTVRLCIPPIDTTTKTIRAHFS